jgi:predicted lipoprotein with Yx(FWY)xxD motif
MRPTLRNAISGALAIGAAALALAACGGEDDEDSASAAGSGNRAAVASVESVDGADVVVDPDGRTLYSADVERGGRIRCTGECTSFWAPVTASAGEARAASADLDLDLATVERPGGRRQLTLDRLPLYTFTQEGAGELEGDGFVDDFAGTRFEWTAARPDGDSASGGGSGSASPY